MKDFIEKIKSFVEFQAIACAVQDKRLHKKQIFYH